MSGAYLIRPVTEADLDLVARWRAQPHVARWWGDSSVESEAEKLDNPLISLSLVEHAGRPFALIQDYAVHDWSPHHLDYLPPGARGMDVFIGETDMLGAGHGPAFIRQHVDQLFAACVPAIGIDPHPDNAAARQAYEKAGFAEAGGPLQTRWGYALLMDRWVRPGDRIVGLYERQAAAWTGARESLPNFVERAWLDRFRALLPDGGEVLDIGCGAGEPIARYLAGLGHAVTGVDSSPAMVAMFKARLPVQNALVADMRTLDLDRGFDGLGLGQLLPSRPRASAADVSDLPRPRPPGRRLDVHQRAGARRGHRPVGGRAALSRQPVGGGVSRPPGRSRV